MRKIAIIGIGQTPVSEHWDSSLLELAGSAVFAALEDANRESVEALYAGNMLSGQLDKQEHLGTLIADWIGLRG
nr:thiolase domain-containing protein [candidate division Zixibacteria bacterium]NIW49244.1 thiolase domain-containing protein [Gammaproteobacteria bacterium]NIR67124.1 thiolase domain-containing protein [candidate division Zixibacteria bacterium]NIS48546.1 thiolase domain-containing protein [candidate division Zixibacteria bacterium]NIT52309.1 thiolase domain-containing protein [candidate division Zixibacteria bacterium]